MSKKSNMSKFYRVDMVKKQRKHCAVCGKIVERGTGIHYAGRLIHSWCKGMAVIILQRRGWL
jgi:hypothetical protein